MTAKDIDIRLNRLINYQTFSVANTFLLGSPWESDRIAISAKMYWTEYEIKSGSVSDYNNDFLKMSSKHAKNPINKHEYYSNPGNVIIKRFGKGFIPKPRRFFFVMPSELAAKVEIPDHCGLIIIDKSSYRGRIIKNAPTLKDHTKVTEKQFYNIATKGSRK